MGKFFDAQGQVIAKTIDGCACDSNVQDFTPGLVTCKFEEDPSQLKALSCPQRCFRRSISDNCEVM